MEEKISRKDAKAQRLGESPADALKAPPSRYAGAIRTVRRTPVLQDSITPLAEFEDDDEDENEAPDEQAPLLEASAHSRRLFTSEPLRLCVFA